MRGCHFEMAALYFCPESEAESEGGAALFAAIFPAEQTEGDPFFEYFSDEGGYSQKSIFGGLILLTIYQNTCVTMNLSR